MPEIGFGIIGCGNISTIHAKAIQAIPEARLRAFHSHSQPKAEKMAQQYGVESEPDLDRFLGRPDIQVVSSGRRKARRGGEAHRCNAGQSPIAD